jgi:hypothetical protein
LEEASRLLQVTGTASGCPHRGSVFLGLGLPEGCSDLAGIGFRARKARESNVEISSGQRENSQPLAGAAEHCASGSEDDHMTCTWGEQASHEVLQLSVATACRYSPQ